MTGIATYGYTTNSPLVGQVLFKQSATNRMTTTKTYDKLNRMTGMVSTPSGGGQLPFSYGASYNEANQRITVTMNDGSYWIYEYDTLGQISSAKKHFADGAFVPGQQFTYSHSNIGNRTGTTVGGTETGVSSGSSMYHIFTNKVNQYERKYRPLGLGVLGTAGVNESVFINGTEPTYRRGEYFWKWLPVTSSATLWTNVVVTSGGETNTGNVFMPGRPEYFTYDLDGNMLSDGRWNYTWDAENRLTSMTVNTNVGPQQRILFEYDYQGRRIAKKVWNNTAGTNDPIVNLKYLYDGWNLIAELDGNNALVRSYTWGMDASGSMQGAGGVGGLLMVNAGSGGVHFPAYDLNGNVMGLVNAANGNISAKYEYGPFGEVFCSVGDMAKVNPFGFSTKYTDPETDLVYYGYRYYSSALGRWMSRDPIEEQGGLNLYGFVNNDPVNNFDLDGKEMGWNICPGCRRRFIDRGSLQFKCPYCGWPPPDEQYPEGFSLCQRDIQKDGCCDVLGILGDLIGGEHTYVQYIDSEGKKWGYGFGVPGVVPENAFNPNHCKKCKRTNRTLRFGGSAGKTGNEATDEEIKDCIKNYPKRKKYKNISLWNRYNCKDWAGEAVLNCSLNCN